MKILDILKDAVNKKASDVHIATGRKPTARIHGEIVVLDSPEVTSEDAKKAACEVIPEALHERFEQGKEVDCGFSIGDIGRFRVNVYYEKKGCAIAFRVISAQIPSPKDIGLEETICNLTKLPTGLILVTGPTGCGKSTTLACLINLVNQQRKDHIITIEDPIEYIFEDKNCIVTQREVGAHTGSFADALKYALRQDPDIVLVGEMRDLETISTAITISETGHLVFATLHTTDAAQTVDRIIDVFPPYQQQQIRMQLSATLRAVVCQNLLITKDRKGRVAAREIMIVNNAIANCIREGKTHQIYSAIQTGGSLGMCSMDMSLARLFKAGLISEETALSKAVDPNTFQSYTRVM